MRGYLFAIFTHLIHAVFDFKDGLADGILALLVSLETFINSFQLNWISHEDGARSDWLEAFPFINFIKCSHNGEAIQIPNSFSPSSLISPLNRKISWLPSHSHSHSHFFNSLVNVNFFLNNLSATGSSFKVVRKDKIRAFLSSDPAMVIHLEAAPVIPGKFQYNPETDGILFEVGLRTDDGTLPPSTFLLLDSGAKSLLFVDPVYSSFVKGNFFVDSRDSFKRATVPKNSPANFNNKWLDRSFSLSGKAA